MKLLLLLAFLAFVAAAPAASAEEATKTLELKAKAVLAKVFPHRNAPFVHPFAQEPDLDLDLALAPETQKLRRQASRASCENATTLCYDASSGRIVYRPARKLMPNFPGLRPENISVKRDRIVFRYSF